MILTIICAVILAVLACLISYNTGYDRGHEQGYQDRKFLTEVPDLPARELPSGDVTWVKAAPSATQQLIEQEVESRLRALAAESELVPDLYGKGAL